MKRRNDYRVIIASNSTPLPERHEVTAAQILANFFCVDVEFIARGQYKSPDLQIGNDVWEIKSPTGTGKRNIERQLQLAMKQSVNIVLDARRSKIHIAKIRSRLSYQAGLAKSLRRLVLITKAGKVEVIK